MITVTLSIDGAAVTIQQQDDDLKALRAVLERLEATLEQRDQHQRIEELEHEVARLRGELNFTREHGAKLMSEREEAEIECREWKREVFALGEALGLGDKWTTADALAAIEAPKKIIAAVRAVAEEEVGIERFDTSPDHYSLVMRLRAALGDET